MKKKIILLGLMVSSSISCSYYWEFGQNKVQYKKFDWQVVDKKEASYLFYPGGEDLVKFTMNVIKEVYDSLSYVFDYQFHTPAPIIIYNSHNDFEQTNIILEIIDEATGGFTDVFKNRAVIPFDGSYARFKHVLVHEFIHVFQFKIRRKSGLESLLEMMNPSKIPLWFLEGMAEYFSTEWDNEADMVIRDALYWGKLKEIPELYKIRGSYLMYKEGHAIVKFIAERYGEKKVVEIFKNASRFKGMESGLKNTIGVGIEELNQMWIKEVKKEFWEKCLDKKEKPEKARKIRSHAGYVYNIGGSISPDGSEIALFSDKEGEEAIYIISTVDGQERCKLVVGGRSSGFESLHIRHGKIGWHPTLRVVVFVGKSKGKDILYVMDVRKRKTIHKFIPQLDQIFCPSFSPDGNFILVRGLKNGRADLYLIKYPEGTLRKLTDDIYDDQTPSWGPDGEYVIFTSDRPIENKKWEYGRYRIFRMNVKKIKDIPKVLSKKESALYLAYPLWIRGKDTVNKILFISDKTGVNNLYAGEIRNDTLINVRRLTNVIGGIFTPSITPDSRFLVFSNYVNLGWDLYLWKNPFSTEINFKDTVKGIKPKYVGIYEDTTTTLECKKLNLRFAPDWGGGGISYTSYEGVKSNVRFSASDLLGNHRLYIVTGTPWNVLLNFYLSYFYLPQKIDLGWAFFKNEYYYYSEKEENIFWKAREIGGGWLISYPWSRFERVELELLGIENYDEKYYYDGRVLTKITENKYWQIGGILSWVHDNSRWGITGPIDGRRAKISVINFYPVVEPALTYQLYKVDLRKYIKLQKRFSFAIRILGKSLWGRDTNFLLEKGWPYLGGADGLRGYEEGEFVGRNIGLLNLEFRYPFIDYLKVAFPLSFVFSRIKGVLFCDIGYCGNDINKFQLFDEENKLKDIKMGFGFGMRMRVSLFVLKFDIAKHTNLVDTSSRTYYHFSLMPEF
jgi:hypothetical protein